MNIFHVVKPYMHALTKQENHSNKHRQSNCLFILYFHQSVAQTHEHMVIIGGRFLLYIETEMNSLLPRAHVTKAAGGLQYLFVLHLHHTRGTQQRRLSPVLLPEMFDFTCNISALWVDFYAA